MTGRCIGIDGCRAGWVAATEAGATVATTLAELLIQLAVTGDHIVAIDMPIGLAETGKRQCDELARKKLAPARQNSVFWTATRAAVDNARDQADASRRNRARQMGGVSAQAFNLFAKIREVDTLLAASPIYRRALVEVHPELSFARWQVAANGASDGKTCIPMAYPKKSALGALDRLSLVFARYPRAHFEAVRAKFPANQLADDDIFDAYAALYTAERIAAGSGVSLPATPPRDARDLPMRIVY